MESKDAKHHRSALLQEVWRSHGGLDFCFLKEFWHLFSWHAQYKRSSRAVSMDAGKAAVTVASRWMGPARGIWQRLSQGLQMWDGRLGKHLLVSLFGDFFDKGQLELHTSQRKWAWEVGRTTFTLSGRGDARKAAQCHGLHLSLTLNEAQKITQISHLLSSGLSQTLGFLAQNEGNNEGKAFTDFSGDGRLLSVSQQEPVEPSENSFHPALYLHLVLALANQLSPLSRILAIS